MCRTSRLYGDFFLFFCVLVVYSYYLFDDTTLLINTTLLIFYYPCFSLTFYRRSKAREFSATVIKRATVPLFKKLF